MEKTQWHHRTGMNLGRLAICISGVLVGAGLAFLFAPQAGRQLRGFLRDSAARSNNELDEVIDHGTEVLASAVRHGQEFVENGKDSLPESGRQTKEFVEGGREALNKTKDKLASQDR